MNERYEILLVPDSEVFEAYERDERNLLRVRIQLPSGEIVTSDEYKVEISMSSEAMIGLATNLIRSAVLNPSSERIWHLHRCEPGFAAQNLGVYLHPESCELLMVQTDLGTLSELIGEP